jgi:hypothetical protein
MDEAAQVQQTIYPTLHRRPSHDKALYHVPLRAADATRSARNISLWNSYLPAACVRTMVRMGWDYTI